MSIDKPPSAITSSIVAAWHSEIVLHNERHANLAPQTRGAPTELV